MLSRSPICEYTSFLSKLLEQNVRLGRPGKSRLHDQKVSRRQKSVSDRQQILHLFVKSTIKSFVTLSKLPVVVQTTARNVSKHTCWNVISSAPNVPPS